VDFLKDSVPELVLSWNKPEGLTHDNKKFAVECTKYSKLENKGRKQNGISMPKIWGMRVSKRKIRYFRSFRVT
jgi:hypothetical protein